MIELVSISIWFNLMDTY